MRAIRFLGAPLALLAVCGVLAGLARLGVGWCLPLAARWALWHGVLMAACLMGAVISLERAVAARRGSGWLAPWCALLAGLALLVGLAPQWSQCLLVTAALALAWVSLCLWRVQPTLHGALLALAPGFWLLGVLVWFQSGDPSAGTLDWLLFLILTIAAERLELSRYQPMSTGARGLFLGLLAWLVCASLFAWWHEADAARATGLGLVGLALWLLRYDIARRTWRTPGATRYIATCLMSGYVWLLFAGGLGVLGAFTPGLPWRDAALHAITLGFVLSMIFGHALIILPAVARVRVAYHPALYVLLFGLHLSLLWRVCAGLFGLNAWLAPAGQANALCLLIFVLTLVCLGRRIAPRTS